MLVSALLRGDGPPGAVLRAVAAQTLTTVVCTAISDEYAAALARPRFGFDAADVHEVLGLVARLARWVDVPAHRGDPPVPDPADWPFIACALAADCPVITGNTRHFPTTGLGVRVITARVWVEGWRG
jgi:predicted nucleic acid-binding protein